jgi:hypothetical protein
MKLTLNSDKVPFCAIGTLYWTSVAPGPIEVNLKTLDKKEVQQIRYNLNRDVLLTDDRSELDPYDNMVVNNQAASIPSPPTMKLQDALEIDRQELRRALEGRVPSVKKFAQELRPGRLRRLVDLEREGKNRKNLLEFLNMLLTNHTETVKNFLQHGEDLEPQDRIRLAQLSTQLSDIIESEKEEVNFNLPSE